MDIHRARFIPYPPSPINALAFSHPSLLSTPAAPHQAIPPLPSNLRLAVGRANGSISIYNPLSSIYHHETTFPGSKDRSIEGLVWTQEGNTPSSSSNNIASRNTFDSLRLFSIGYSTHVTEWDLSLGQPARHYQSGGEVWCLASQPSRFISDGEDSTQDLAIGCADGAIVVLSTASRDLKPKKVLSRPSKKKSRVLSISWQKRQTIIAGCADGTIRVLDTRNGNVIRNLGLGSGPRGGPKEILVWAVQALPNGDLVSGDSTGQVRIWDGRTYGLVQSLKGHRADCLTLAVGEGGSLMSGGMDRRTVAYRRSGTLGEIKGRERWAVGNWRRIHGGDIKAMAVFEWGGVSVVASGGLDTNLVLTPLREYGRENHRALSSLPQDPPLVSAAKARYIMSYWEREIWIWHLSRSASPLGASNDPSVDSNPRRLVAKIGIKGEEFITSAAITPTGNLLAVATISEIKMFRLRPRSSTPYRSLNVQKLAVPAKLAKEGGKLVQFSPDGKWLFVISISNRIYVARIQGDGKTLHVRSGVAELKRQRRARREEEPQLDVYARTISKVAISWDSRILVAGDLTGNLDSFVLEGQEETSIEQFASNQQAQKEPSSSSDSESVSSLSSASDDDNIPPPPRRANGVVLGQRWIHSSTSASLPKLPSAPLIISFRPPSATTGAARIIDGTSSRPAHTNKSRLVADNDHHDEDRLVIITAKHDLFEFHASTGKLTEWSRRNPSHQMPKRFQMIRDRAMGSIWDTQTGRERLWLYGSSWLFMFDLGQDIADGEAGQGKHKRKRQSPVIGLKGNSTRNTSGAGNQVSQPMIDTGIGRKIRRLNEKGEEAGEEINITRVYEVESDEDIGGYSKDRALARLRGDFDMVEGGWTNGSLDSRQRPKAEKTEQANTSLSEAGAKPHSDNEQDEENASASEDDSETGDTSTNDAAPTRNGIHPTSGSKIADPVHQILLAGRPPNDSISKAPSRTEASWLTLKYRPILGIVPIDHLPREGTSHEDCDSPLEVVLVERPLWDADLPMKLFGDQEWDK